MELRPLYIYMEWVAKADGNAVGEADDDIPWQLNRYIIAAENKGSESWVVGGKITRSNRARH